MSPRTDGGGPVHSDFMSEVWSEPASRLKASRAFRRLCAGRGNVERLPIPAAAWIFGLLAEERGRAVLFLVPHEFQAQSFVDAARLFGFDAEQFTAPSLTPYQAVAPFVAVRAQEVAALDRVARGQVRLLTAAPRALFRPLPATSTYETKVLVLKAGREFPMEALAAKLASLGYQRRDLVSDVGEFAIRGGVADCYPAGASLPLRIDFFGDVVESIRVFDPDDQRSRATLETTRIPPLELFAQPGALEQLGRLLSERQLGYEAATQVRAALEGEPFPGWENYLPLLAEERLTLPEWLGDGPLVVAVEPATIAREVDRYARHLQRDFEVRLEAGQLAADPEQLEHPRRIVEAIVTGADVVLDSVAGRDETAIDFAGGLTDILHQQLPRFPAEVEAALGRGERVIVVVESREHRARIERMCRHYDVPTGRGGVEIIEGRLDRGFRLPAAGIVLLSEAQLFLRPPAVPRRRSGAQRLLSTLRDLRVGDFVVHEDHGIGQFAGLRTVGTDERETAGLPPVLFPEADERPTEPIEVMEIRYAGDQTLLLPPSRLDLIQRYSGSDEAPPKLDRLGGTSWARAKERVRSGLRQLAVDLLKLYAERRLSSAARIAEDSDLLRQFEASFDFEPTPDQLEAIGEIKADLEGDEPMDRLLCGDVGFGKTEVAMRAAFKVVDGGYQVAVLAPTTILADQHFETFRQRFADFPVEIDMVSRFRSEAEIRRIRERAADAKVDILIGTHRLLSRDIELPNLGLLIIDEEQRFGVAQKERLKGLKKNLHVLALTATPVPRTLQLSLAGVRDLSTIETPPRDRLAIETAVTQFSDELVREAIEYELDRGGQVYYVFNRVAGIGGMAERLRTVCGDIRLVVGHGQLEEAELSRRMHAFKAGDYDVLLATTIIENGIDIPNVNTMIVHQADRFGLAQLYQLRGRVGRSSQLAYCYLLVSSDAVLSETSRRRLEAIREFTELGAGFRVAARDLEIRGAGHLLGAEQSGHISAVGLETYLKLLDQAVRELRGEAVEEEVSASISLPIKAVIPAEYIGDANLRMEVYRRIAAGSEDDGELLLELQDRFGDPPSEIRELMSLASIRRSAEKLRIQSITGGRKRLKVRFRHDTLVSAETLIRLVGQQPNASFDPSGVLTLDGLEQGPWIETTQELLERLAQ